MKKAYNSISAVSSAAVVGIVILINLFAGRLPSSVTSVDLSSDGLISVSPLTEEVLADLSVETSLYWIVEGGNENTQIEYLLERYKELSGLISSEKVDPVVYPDFAADYTDSALNNNSILVKQGTRGRYIDYYELFTVDYGTYGDGLTDTVFHGEQLITGAISTLMNNYENTVYFMIGHNEAELPESVETVLVRENYDIKELNLITQTKVPSDADAVIISAPEKDLSSAETAMLLDYLNQGGNLILFAPYSSENMPNLDSVSSVYGLEKAHGIVFENDPGKYYDTYQMYLIPQINRHEISESIMNGNYTVIAPLCDGFLPCGSAQHDCELSVILESSEKSYAKTEGYDIRTVKKENQDIDGPFILCAAISDKTAGGRVVLFASSRLIDEDVDAVVSGSNSELVINAVDWLTERELNLNIRPKYLTAGKLTISDALKLRYSVILLALIPGLFAAVGTVVFLKRKHR